MIRLRTEEMPRTVVVVLELLAAGVIAAVGATFILAIGMRIDAAIVVLAFAGVCAVFGLIRRRSGGGWSE
jgi:hypothetical protein